MPRFCTASLFSDSGEVRSDLELHTPMMKGALIYIGLSDSGEVRSDLELHTPMMKGALIYIGLSDSGEVRSDLELHTPMMKGALIYIGLSDSGEVRSDFELYTSMIGGEWSCISTVCLISPPRLTAHGTNLKNAWLPSGTEVCASFAGGAEPLPYGMRQIRVCICSTVGVRGCNSA